MVVVRRGLAGVIGFAALSLPVASDRDVLRAAAILLARLFRLLRRLRLLDRGGLRLCRASAEYEGQQDSGQKGSRCRVSHDGLPSSLEVCTNSHTGALFGESARKKQDKGNAKINMPRRFPAERFARVGLASALLPVLLMGGNAVANTLNFDSTPAGMPPEGWTLTKTGQGQSKWTVEADATAPSKPNVLKQSGRATFPVAIKNDSSVRDGFVEVKFKAVAGSEDRAAGIIWRAKDADNYYVVRANALEDNVVLYKTIKGVRTSLDIVGRKGGYGVSTPVASRAMARATLRLHGKPVQGDL
ncbi:hypothetical protein [Bradyrhizobium guangxiense]|uniref:hypothetical protein n=1 Tax=Bradyrhizobium guangxiense TaxID=1325115 RepID=UPI001FE0A661|nr:hypothetical protein [Bradyrhizobium guangxiense]